MSHPCKSHITKVPPIPIRTGTDTDADADTDTETDTNTSIGIGVTCYGVATVSRIDKITGLFCKMSSLL